MKITFCWTETTTKEATYNVPEELLCGTDAEGEALEEWLSRQFNDGLTAGSKTVPSGDDGVDVVLALYDYERAPAVPQGVPEKEP